MSNLKNESPAAPPAAAVATTTSEVTVPGKAGPCQVCGKQAAKYCCPRCDKKTCSLDCVKEHKEQAKCSGKRDRTAFLGRGQLDESSLLSDYRFLEEVKRADDVAKRSKPPAPKHELPHFLQSLVHQAARRGVQLHLLPPGMQRRRANTTRYDAKHHSLSWRVEWSFLGAECTAVDARIHEACPLGPALLAHLQPPAGATLKSPEMQKYADCGLEGLVVAMRKERTPANAPEYFKMDLARSLGESLQGKVVVEFPVLLVLLPGEAEKYAWVAAAEKTATESPAEEGAGVAAAGAGPPVC